MRSEKKQGMQIKEGLVGHCKDFGLGFDFKYDGNLWRVLRRKVI